MANQVPIFEIDLTVEIDGTGFLKELEPSPYRFEELVGRLYALANCEIFECGDKTSFEISGRFNGEVFRLYDYKSGRSVHIGGKESLEVDLLIKHLFCLLEKVKPKNYTAISNYNKYPKVPIFYYYSYQDDKQNLIFNKKAY